FYFLFVSESFLWVSETFIGVAWMFLFFAVTIHLGRRNVNIFLLLIPFSLLAALTIFSHFVIIIPTFFLLVFLILEKKNWPFSKKNSVLLISALAVIIALKCLDTSSQPYDQNNLYGLTHFSLQDIINTFTSPILVSFFFRCLTNYWVAIIIFILGIVSLVKHKEKKLAAWIIISLIGNFIVLGLTYPKWDWIGHCFHIESEFASVAVIVAAGFAFSFLPRLTPKVASALLAAIFIIRFIYICIAATPFTLRTNFNEQILAQMRKKGIPKLCIINEDRLLSTNMLSWGLPYESLMMSEMDGDKPQLTFFLVNIDDKHTQEMIADTKSFYNSFNIIPASFLNKKYFSIDTIQPYSIMTYNDLFK
ncbi:MAG TPA: hypothetical protein VK588_06345, partial [Chitinophagaceae bacterium]|nr:hypothetical protein [Chitinophagaceae bacterium]